MYKPVYKREESETKTAEVSQEVDYPFKLREFGLGRYYLNIPHRYLDIIGWKKGEPVKMILVFRQGHKGRVVFVPAEDGV